MTPRSRIGHRVLLGLAVLALLDVMILAANVAGFRINKTASMPLGIYRLRPARAEPLARDLLVAICPSGDALRVGLARGYLRPGPCPGNVEPLLKRIAAVAGDAVSVTDSRVAIDGSALPNSGRVARDCQDRAVPRIPAGTYRILPGKIWLFAPVPRSWDSRYFGPQRAADVVGIATPVLIVGNGQPCAV
jgi:conjugative transfer signal peptidase TraF